MTINTLSISTGPYTGTGVLATYVYDFKVQLDSEIVVVETDVAGVQTTLTLGGGFSVTGVGNNGGGTVIRIAGNLPVGYKWFISRLTALTQAADFPDQGAFTPESHENAFDKLTALIQEIDTNILDLPSGSRANQLYSFDSSGSSEANINADAVRAMLAGALATGVAMTVDSFTGTGSQTDFTMSINPVGTNAILATIDGVVQLPTIDYTLQGAIVTFLIAPPNNASVVLRNLGNTAPVSGLDSTSITHTVSRTGAVQRNVQIALMDRISIKDFGAVGDGVVNDTAAISAWLDVLISTGQQGDASGGTFLMNTSITKAIAGGLSMVGDGTFKCGGSNRVDMFHFTGCTGKFSMDGITIDGGNISARPLQIFNLLSSPTTLGQVWIGEGCRFINAKNNSPDSFTTSAVWIEGGFTDVAFEGEIDGVDSDSTSGAVTIGLHVNWDAGDPDDWVRRLVITGKSRIRNIKNDNASVENADGVSFFAPVGNQAFFAVQPGALFSECEGRAIKSQVMNNAIDSPIIFRSLYDGLAEIDLQYSGGHVIGALVHHDGRRANSIINATLALSPDNTQFTVSGNQLTVTGAPATDTKTMVEVGVDNATVKLQGITIRDNKVKGTVEHMVNARVANVVNVNRLIIDANWAETISTSFINMGLFGANRAQLTVVFINNGAENACTGSTIVASGDLLVEYERGNHNITPLLGTVFSVEISAGVLTPYASTTRVNTEASAGTDDLDTITAINRSEDDWLTLRASNDARTVVCKDGTGNLRLAGDFSLDNVDDRLVLSFDGTNWLEISRSDNAA